MYIVFSSDKKISIKTNKQWDRIIEYSYDNKKWYEWNGEKIINNVIYMRGINNTIISNGIPWSIKGKNIKCQGNIENLLDYQLVINNVHPIMQKRCFACMFRDCTALIEAPQLLATQLTDYCYCYMFDGCTALITAPNLPAVTLAERSYGYMFRNCFALTKMPLIMATHLNVQSCCCMFEACVSLTEVTNLYVSRLADGGVFRMFWMCKSLTSSPSFNNLLTVKEAIAYHHIFEDCQSLSIINVNNKLYDINVLKLL